MNTGNTSLSGPPRHTPPTAHFSNGLDLKGRLSYTHSGWKSGRKPSGTCISLMSSMVSEEEVSAEIGSLYHYSAEHNLYVFQPRTQTYKQVTWRQFQLLHTAKRPPKGWWVLLWLTSTRPRAAQAALTVQPLSGTRPREHSRQTHATTLPTGPERTAGFCHGNYNVIPGAQSPMQGGSPSMAERSAVINTRCVFSENGELSVLSCSTDKWNESGYVFSLFSGVRV